MRSHWCAVAGWGGSLLGAAVWFLAAGWSGVGAAARGKPHGFRYSFRQGFRCGVLVVGVLLGGAGFAAAEEDEESVRFFENKVRPVLVEHCQGCHGAEKQKGGLRVDSLAALTAGGDSGPSLEPGDVENSLLVTAIRYEDAGLQMPPKGKLSEAQIADLTRWVKLGAKWPASPGTDAPGTTGPTIRKVFEITEADRNYWAYRPVVRPTVPVVAGDGAAQPIDAFIAAKLTERGLTPNGKATKRELIRRAYFDLIGLPPSPEAIAEFEADASPEAFSKLVDRLLALPEYGERWGRYWLDVVRYAQSSGYERDDEIPYAWRYRDYVIQAFNADKPYDRFILEQLAGDELAPDSQEALIATGFYRIGTWDDEPDDARAAEFDNLDDVIVTTSAAFLGSTIGCARCHDHKLDPFSQADYYKLVSVFRNLAPFERPRRTLNSNVLAPLEAADKVAGWRAEVEAARKDLEQRIAAAADDAARKPLQDELNRLNGKEFPGEWALVARERLGKPAATHLLVRGNAGQPGAEVTPGLPTVLGGAGLAPERARDEAPAAGLRLAFARWVASKENPLTARVLVNRVWQHHFGQGLVKTTTDFGKGGMLPTHPELVDWLAAEFMESGWSIKQLHRVILASDAWQRSSNAEQAEGMRVDPGNDWLWRQNLRRLEAESIRDTVLAISGTLNLARGGRGFFPHLSGEVLAGSSRPGNGWSVSTAAEQNRRSIYAFVKRSVLVPLLEMFDYSNVNQPLGERQNTTVAPQALMLLNDEFLLTQARAFSERLTKEAGEGTEARIERAYRLAVGRGPTAREREVAQAYLERLVGEYGRQSAQLTFRPDVPDSLHRSYLSQIRGAAMLKGPAAGWSYFTGRWFGDYEGIAQMDLQRGPFGLVTAEVGNEGMLTGSVELYQASEFGSLLVRGRVEGELYRGVEIQFDPREERVRVVRVAEKTVTVLGETKYPVPTGRAVPVRVELAGATISLWLGEAAAMGERSVITLSVQDPEPLEGTRVGVRAVGAPLRLNGMRFVSAKGEIDLVRPPAAGSVLGIDALRGWSRLGGEWSLVEGGGVAVRPAPGAKLVWEGPRLVEGSLEAEFQMGAEGGDVGFCVGVSDAKDGVDSLNGWNINIRKESLRVGRHEQNWRELVSVPVTVPATVGTDQWQHVRIEIAGRRLVVWLNRPEQPTLEFELPAALVKEASQVALRTYQAGFAVRNLKVTVGERTFFETFRPEVRPVEGEGRQEESERAEANRRAWETLCLTILNLNEVVYVD
jgi:hypothetical protein